MGKLNGYGGKIQPGESPEVAVVREIMEESRLTVDLRDLRPSGTLVFDFPFERDFDHHVHVFTADAWQGEPVETAEMVPFWHAVDRLPFDRMWADDPHWLPFVLAGHRIDATFTFAEDNESLSAWHVRWQ